MSREEARDAILAGHTVVMTVGTSPEDPVLHLSLDDGTVYSQSVAGWSAGCLEPVCGADSPFLLEYLTDRHDLRVAAPA